jgi:hypothetical protein
MASTDIGTDELDFPVVLRGFDRDTVRQRLQELGGQLASERRRAVQAENTLAQARRELLTLRESQSQGPSFEHLGAEAAAVLEQAGRSGKILVDEARGRAGTIVAEAEARASEIGKVAERSAAEVRARADEDAKRTLEETRKAAETRRAQAQAEQASLESHGKRLREVRDQALSDLGEIRTHISTAIEDVVDPEAPAPARAGQPEKPEVARGWVGISAHEAEP